MYSRSFSPQDMMTALRSITAGASISLLILLPPSNISPIGVHRDQTGIHASSQGSASLDGTMDASIVFLPSTQGLRRIGADETAVLPSLPRAAQPEISDTDLARELETVSGLDRSRLARLAGVSRVSYHRWLQGGRLLPENSQKLRALLDAMQTLKGIKEEALTTFLITEINNVTPFELLRAGHYGSAIGLSLMGSSFSQSPTMRTETALRSRSGVPSWIRPVRGLGWATKPGSEALADALERYAPRALPEAEIDYNPTADEEGVVAVRIVFVS